MLVLIATCLLEGAAVVATVVGDQVGVIGSRAGQAPPRAGLSDRGPFVAKCGWNTAQAKRRDLSEREPVRNVAEPLSGGTA